MQQQFSSTFTDSAQIHELTAEAESLAQTYLAASVVTPKYADDARHVAIATVHGLAVISRVPARPPLPGDKLP